MQPFEKVMTALQQGEAALLFDLAACRYLTGFDYTDGGVLLLSDAAYLLTDSRYIEAAQEAVPVMTCLACDRIYETVNELLARHAVKTLLVERSLSLSAFAKLQETMVVAPTADGRLDAVLAAARMIKTPEECAWLREAQRLTELGFSHILEYLRPGVTERDAALELEFFMRRTGAEGVSFDFIVVSGKNTSRPHGVPTDKCIETGDFVTMDFGALYHGYHADMTRTVAVGSVSAEHREVYDTVLRAQKATLQMLRAGVSGKAADAAARTVIADAGFGDYFGHGTGHGVGVEIHEQPRLSPKAPDQPLPAGCMVTVEPGIYLPGKFGVRIEDMVLLTDDGCENFTTAPKELLIL